MFLKLRPLLYAVIFAVGLEIIANNSSSTFYAATFFLLTMSLFEGKKMGGKWKYSILPVIFTVTSVAQLYLIGPYFEKQLFILLVSSIYYMAVMAALRLGDYENDQTARGMNTAASTAAIFLGFSAAYGIYLNFLVPLYALMFSYLILTLLISYQNLSLIKADDRQVVWIYSLLLALVLAELIWTMNFWPFGYLTTGVIALILYYVLWDVVQSHFLEILNKKRIMANMIFFSVLIAFVLVTSKWIPVI